jgi:hypothetical protein
MPLLDQCTNCKLISMCVSLNNKLWILLILDVLFANSKYYIFVIVRIIDLDKYHDCVGPDLIILVIKVK